MIIRAAQGAQDIPAGFPILLSSEMQIIEPAFARRASSSRPSCILGGDGADLR